MIVTSSELGTYDRCRRRWSLSSHNGARLAPVRTPRALELGTRVHAGLEALLRGAELQAECVDDAEARDLVTHYYLRWWPHLLPGPVLDLDGEPAIEMTAVVPLDEDDDLHLALTLDAAYTDDRDRVWIVDHKTFNPMRTPRESDLLMSPQFRGYLWAARRLWPDREVAGVLYNGLAKRRPRVPRGPVDLRDPAVRRATSRESVSAWAATSGHLRHPAVRDALVELSEPAARARWHVRYELEPSERALDAWHRAAVARAREMREARKSPPGLQLANFRWEGCQDCAFMPYCHSLEHGESPPTALYERSSYRTLERLEEEGLL